MENANTAATQNAKLPGSVRAPQVDSSIGPQVDGSIGNDIRVACFVNCGLRKTLPLIGCCQLEAKKGIGHPVQKVAANKLIPSRFTSNCHVILSFAWFCS